MVNLTFASVSLGLPKFDYIWWFTFDSCNGLTKLFLICIMLGGALYTQNLVGPHFHFLFFIVGNIVLGCPEFNETLIKVPCSSTYLIKKKFHSFFVFARFLSLIHIYSLQVERTPHKIWSFSNFLKEMSFFCLNYTMAPLLI